jgi:hypothetical protein
LLKSLTFIHPGGAKTHEKRPVFILGDTCIPFSDFRPLFGA